MREIAEQIKNLCDASLYLIEIPPKNGKPSKSPSGGWNKPKSDCNPNGYSNNPDDFESRSTAFEPGSTFRPIFYISATTNSKAYFPNLQEIPISRPG